MPEKDAGCKKPRIRMIGRSKSGGFCHDMWPTDTIWSHYFPAIASIDRARARYAKPSVKIIVLCPLDNLSGPLSPHTSLGTEIRAKKWQLNSTAGHPSTGWHRFSLNLACSSIARARALSAVAPSRGKRIAENTSRVHTYERRVNGRTVAFCALPMTVKVQQSTKEKPPSDAA